MLLDVKQGVDVRPPVFSTTCAHCSEGMSMLPMTKVYGYYLIRRMRRMSIKMCRVYIYIMPSSIGRDED